MYPRLRGDDRSSRNDLLFAAAFAAFVVFLSVNSTGAAPLLAPLPTLLVAFLFALVTILRGPFLRLAGLLLGVLYTPASVLLSLLSAFRLAIGGDEVRSDRTSHVSCCLSCFIRVHSHAV